MSQQFHSLHHCSPRQDALEHITTEPERARRNWIANDDVRFERSLPFKHEHAAGGGVKWAERCRNDVMVAKLQVVARLQIG